MVFKLAHLSDLHLGYSATRKVNAQGINLREVDGYITFGKIVDDVIENEVDAVVIAGDTFHTANPNIRSIQFAQKQLWRLWRAHIPVYILAGNHDVNDVKEDIASSQILNDQWKKIYSHAEPYVKHEIGDGIHLHMVSHHMYSEQANTMSQIKPVEGEINIFSTHGSVIDPILEMKLHTENSPREIVIPNGLLDGLDWSYTLLGHIHERGWVGSTDKKTDTSNSKIYYNGSSIRRGFADKEMPLGRGWTLWEIDSQGLFTPHVKQIAQRPQFDFEPIDAKELSPSEITDKIVENLKTTQDNGTEFNSRTAPIIRQKLINLTAAKYDSLDQKVINNNTEHTMHWDLKKQFEFMKSSSNEIDTDIIQNEVDIVKAYDTWSENSSTLQSLSEKMREKVLKEAKNFVQMGQEISLENE